MIVRTKVKNLCIFSVTRSVLSDDVVVLNMLTIDASLGDYFVMEKLIAKTAQMKTIVIKLTILT